MLHGLMGGGGEGFGLFGVPYDGGGAVAEIGVETWTAEVCRLCSYCAGGDVVDELLHVEKVGHAHFCVLKFRSTDFLPVVTSIYEKFPGVNTV